MHHTIVMQSEAKHLDFEILRRRDRRLRMTVAAFSGLRMTTPYGYSAFGDDQVIHGT